MVRELSPVVHLPRTGDSRRHGPGRGWVTPGSPAAECAERPCEGAGPMSGQAERGGAGGMAWVSGLDRAMVWRIAGLAALPRRSKAEGRVRGSPRAPRGARSGGAGRSSGAMSSPEHTGSSQAETVVLQAHLDIGVRGRRGGGHRSGGRRGLPGGGRRVGPRSRTTLGAFADRGRGGSRDRGGSRRDESGGPAVGTDQVTWLEVVAEELADIELVGPRAAAASPASPCSSDSRISPCSSMIVVMSTPGRVRVMKVRAKGSSWSKTCRTAWFAEAVAMIAVEADVRLGHAQLVAVQLVRRISANASAQLAPGWRRPSTGPRAWRRARRSRSAPR